MMMGLDDMRNWNIVVVDEDVSHVDIGCVPYADTQLSVEWPAQGPSIKRDCTSDHFRDVVLVVVFLEVFVMWFLASDF